MELKQKYRARGRGPRRDMGVLSFCVCVFVWWGLYSFFILGLVLAKHTPQAYPVELVNKNLTEAQPDLFLVL